MAALAVEVANGTVGNGASPPGSGTSAGTPFSPESQQKDGFVLHPDLINEHVKQAKYAVRGELYLRAEQLRAQGREIIFTNVGNPQSLGAKPLTFIRQVIALCSAPFLMDNPDVGKLFPADAISRAKKLLASFNGAVGAYTDSRGNAAIRKDVAEFIEKRDGYPANPENIYLGDGASAGVRMVLSTIIRTAQDGILCPIPQYPLYSAAITLYGGQLLEYFLDESSDWALDLVQLQSAVDTARQQGVNVRALVFINPGNPTGQCLSYENLASLIKFAYKEKLVLLADEVYQELTYHSSHPFISAKKVLFDLGEPYSKHVELFSFHSISKGVVGECGLRGGYTEIVNLHPDTLKEFYKLASINLCPNTIGQIGVSLMVKPPTEESAESNEAERSAELASLSRRAAMVSGGFNELGGMSCNATLGGMYSFPQLDLPPKALAAAKEAGKAPDVFYCLKLLEATGISTVPGSGFGQQPGTAHFRTTILPREEVMQKFCDKFAAFHTAFMVEYA